MGGCFKAPCFQSAHPASRAENAEIRRFSRNRPLSGISAHRGKIILIDRPGGAVSRSFLGVFRAEVLDTESAGREGRYMFLGDTRRGEGPSIGNNLRSRNAGNDRPFVGNRAAPDSTFPHDPP